MATEMPLNWAEFQAKIEKQTGLELKDLPRKRTYLWVARRTPLEVQMMMALLQAANKPVPAEQMLVDLTPMIINRLQPWPMNPDYTVAEMFDDDVELRVYAMAVLTNKAVHCVRYKIVKACPLPVFALDEMSFEVWTNQIAEEWEGVNSDVNAAEEAIIEERDAVITYLQSLPDDYRVKDAADDIGDENHLVETDDEPDAEGDKPDGDSEDNEDDEEKSDDKGTAQTTEQPAAAAPAAT
jgi:hypothetical protein